MQKSIKSFECSFLFRKVKLTMIINKKSTIENFEYKVRTFPFFRKFMFDTFEFAFLSDFDHYISYIKSYVKCLEFISRVYEKASNSIIFVSFKSAFNMLATIIPYFLRKSYTRFT